MQNAPRHRSPSQPTYILKVIPSEGHHLCGICRSRYRQMKTAENCLAKCWQKTRDIPLVAPRVIGMGRVIFRCLLCSRDYTSENEAHLCVEDCVKIYDGRLQKLMKGLGIALVPHTPKQFSKRVIQPHRYDAKNRRHPPEEEAKPKLAAAAADTSAATPENLPADAKAQAAPASKTGAAATPEKADLSDQKKVKEHKKRNRADYPKPWVRKNAEYECTVCNTRFFTRNETEQCFNSHFDAQGVYQEKAA